MECHSTKQKISDEERLELASKLDKDLDEFIDSLEKKRYTEGWPEDRWEEVIYTIGRLLIQTDYNEIILLNQLRKWTNIHSS